MTKEKLHEKYTKETGKPSWTVYADVVLARSEYFEWAENYLISLMTIQEVINSIKPIYFPFSKEDISSSWLGMKVCSEAYGEGQIVWIGVTTTYVEFNVSFDKDYTISYRLDKAFDHLTIDGHPFGKESNN